MSCYAHAWFWFPFPGSAEDAAAKSLCRPIETVETRVRVQKPHPVRTMTMFQTPVQGRQIRHVALPDRQGSIHTFQIDQAGFDLTWSWIDQDVFRVKMSMPQPVPMEFSQQACY